MFEAARLTDPIEHTSALTGFLIGAVLGVALIAAVAFATFTCGFGVALLAGLAAGIGATAILGLGEAIGRMFSSPSGSISSASSNVFTNSRGAAYATASTNVCSKHNPLPLVAEGSGSVFINGLPASRKDDAITCGARIGDGSNNVFIGGGRVTYLPVEDEVPAWLRTTVDWAFALAGLVGGLAGLVRAAGGLSRAVVPCAAKFIGGFMIGEAVGRYVAAPVVSRAMGGLFGQPVDVATGRKVLLAQDEIDFVAAAPLPVVIARFYSSGIGAGGCLGSGWMLPWEQRLQARDGQLWWTDDQGRETGFPIVPPGHTLYSKAEQRYLACTRDGRYIMYDLNERYYDFGCLDIDGGAIGRLQRIEDRCGQWQAYERDANGRVHAIRAGGNLHLRLRYSASGPERLAAIERLGDAPAMLVTYDYDALGQLVAVTDANGNVARTFTYADGLMTSHTNALGYVSRYAWSDIGGQPRVGACWSSEGERAEFTYDLAARRTHVRDESGRTAHWVYDEQLQVLECMDLDGGVYRMAYDDAGQPTLIELPGERTVKFEYDDAARIVAETDPLGRRTEKRYDGNSVRVSEVTLPDGTRWRARFDYLGRLLSTTDPLDRVERYEYPPGLGARPEAHVDARGGRQTMAWFPRGQLASYTDCSGRTTRYDYDAAGNLTAVTDALGNTTHIACLPTGEPVKVQLPEGSVQEYVYDAAGFLVGHSAGTAHSRWLRNARGQVLEAIDPAQQRLHYRYDARGRLTGLAAGASACYGFSYDAGDRLVHELRPDGVERHLRYGATGGLVAIDEIGAPAPAQPGRARRTTRFERDKMDRLLAQSTATSVVTYRWDEVDRIIAAERTPTGAGAALGVTASKVGFDYDRAGRLVAEHGREGTVAYTLDALDNLASLGLPHEQRIDMLRYGSGHVHQIRVLDRVVSDVERDALHREVQRTQGALTQRIGYDALGRRSWQAAGTDPGALGLGLGRLWRSYRYDPSGELAEQRDSVRGRIEFNYDPAGRLLRQVREAGLAQEQFAWDAADNLLDNMGDRPGRIEGNRLMVWQDIRFDYDPWGNVIAKRKGAHLAQHYVFDDEDRLVAVKTRSAHGSSETRFEYDPFGRRIASTAARLDALGTRAARRTRFVWQGLRMVQELRDSAISNYVYSPDDAYTPLARVDALIGGAIAAAGIERARQTARTYHFHTDSAGTPLEVTDEAGELAWAGKYGAWGKVQDGEDAALIPRIDQPLRYPGQYADESTGLHYNTFRFYDPDIGRFISQDPVGLLGGENLYAYAPNPTGWIDPLGWCVTTTVTRGAQGQPLKATARIAPSDIGTGTGTTSASRRLARAMGLPTDDAGHIVAKLLGGSGGKKGVFPQLSSINRGRFQIFEGRIADRVRATGAVDVELTFKYANGGTRPTAILYDVYQNGAKVLGAVFGN